MSKSESFWIRHLLRRAGFGYSPEELAFYNELGYEKSLDVLLRPDRQKNAELENLIKNQEFDFTSLRDLQRFWLFRMAFSNCPLEEKMTLFWHGHFATSDRKIMAPYLMYLQNQTMRRLCLGNFHEMLYSVSKDPAMIMWLDNQQNRKGTPNENYAREIMELFTLGIGNYTESDVKAAARAFTGWHATPEGFKFRPGQHDYGSKTVLGETGNLNGDDVVRILVNQVATGRHLSRKLCLFFVNDQPSESLVARIASVYHSGGYSVRKMLRAIFTDDEFLSEKSYHAKIKSPAELVVGAVKMLQVQRLDPNLPQVMEKMGQSLFQPPNVKGWDGGTAWLSADKMMERFNFAQSILTSRFNELERLATPDSLLSSCKIATSDQAVSYFLDLLVDGDVPPSAKTALHDYFQRQVPEANGNRVSMLDTKLRGLVHLIMSLPTYQLA